MGPTNKKKDDPFAWEKDVQFDADNGENDINFDPVVGPDRNNIDDSMEAPVVVRNEVGSLEKPEDRLTALRKTYPDAQPFGDGNFIMTDPETGKTFKYNRESWWPSAGDIASITPEIGEGVGGVVGAIGGAAAGTLAGPGAGNIAGGIAGAGGGAGLGRETVQRLQNWFYGNDDTRTGWEQAKDFGKTVAINAAGDGIGRGVVAVGGKAINAGKRAIMGQVDDFGKLTQRADDADALGYQPTAGMLSGDARTAAKEHALAPTSSGKQISDRIEQAFAAQDNEFRDVVDGVTSRTNPNARPTSRADLGERLQEQARQAKAVEEKRIGGMYDKVGELTGEAPVSGVATKKALAQLQETKAGMNKSDQLMNGTQVNRAIKYAGSISDDIDGGMTFNGLRKARTDLDKIIQDPSTNDVLRGHLQNLRGAITDDLGTTADSVSPDAKQAWQEANTEWRQFKDKDTGFGDGSDVDKIINKNSDVVYNYAMGQSKEGGNRLRNIKTQILKGDNGAETWDRTVGSTLERIGTDADGNYSPTLFAKNMRSMSPEAREELLGPGADQFVQRLDRLRRIAEDMKPYNRSANHSNTQTQRSVLEEMNPADAKAVIATVVGGAPGAGVAVAAKGANYWFKGYQAKLLANPQVVEWLDEATRAQIKKGGMAAHWKAVDAIRKTVNPATRTAIDALMRETRYKNQQEE